MSMHVETKNFAALQCVTTALGVIDAYRSSQDRADLQKAKGLLEKAVRKDPGYFQGNYYRALVEEMLGERAQAISALDGLLNVAPEFDEEVRYNLAIAHYHGYDHEALERAMPLFDAVVQKSKDDVLRLLATAGLAQAHAMHEIPKRHDDADATSIKSHYIKAKRFAESVLDDLSRLSPERIDRAAAADIQWSAYNAMGMASMYMSDEAVRQYGRSSPEAKCLVLEGIAALQQAEKARPNRWENVCDLASANMRLGYATDQAAPFDQAETYLKLVLTQLRPDYPFAQYELGRLHRIRGKFGPAIVEFRKALAVPKEERDVSDRRLNTELERAERQDPTFP